jgi:hypothetical protein
MWQKIKIFKNTLFEIISFLELTFWLNFLGNGLENNSRWHQKSIERKILLEKRAFWKGLTLQNLKKYDQKVLGQKIDGITNFFFFFFNVQVQK